MSIVSKIAIILTLSFAIILITDIFYNYALVGLRGQSIILDLMYNHNIYLIFAGAISILIYLMALKEEDYRKANRLEELNKVYPLLYTIVIPLVIIIILATFNPITEYFKDVQSYLVFMFSMLLFSYAGILMFIGIYSRISNSHYIKSILLRMALIFSGAAFFSNFIHLVIFEKLGLSSDCSFTICYEVNNTNIILFLALAYALYTIMFWIHSDILFRKVKIIFAVLAFSTNTIVTYYVSKWLPIDWALALLTLAYIYYIHQMIKMACTKQSETIVKYGSLWGF